MPVLKVAERERFCQSRARGNGLKQAAMDAGYAEASASQRAYKLSKLEEVQERIVELTRQIQRQRVTTSAISREACESRLWEEAQDMENSPAARI